MYTSRSVGYYTKLAAVNMHGPCASIPGEWLLRFLIILDSNLKLVNDAANLWAGTQSLPSPIVESGGVASESDEPVQI